LAGIGHYWLVKFISSLEGKEEEHKVRERGRKEGEEEREEGGGEGGRKEGGEEREEGGLG